jgi:hypothetical protein
MLGVAAYQRAYVVMVYEGEDGQRTPAWDAESAEASEFVRMCIAEGVLSIPGKYVVYFESESPAGYRVKKID